VFTRVPSASSMAETPLSRAIPAFQHDTPIRTVRRHVRFQCVTAFPVGFAISSSKPAVAPRFPYSCSVAMAPPDQRGSARDAMGRSRPTVARSPDRSLSGTPVTRLSVRPPYHPGRLSNPDITSVRHDQPGLRFSRHGRFSTSGLYSSERGLATMPLFGVAQIGPGHPTRTVPRQMARRSPEQAGMPWRDRTPFTRSSGQARDTKPLKISRSLVHPDARRVLAGDHPSTEGNSRLSSGATPNPARTSSRLLLARSVPVAEDTSSTRLTCGPMFAPPAASAAAGPSSA